MQSSCYPSFSCQCSTLPCSAFPTPAYKTRSLGNGNVKVLSIPIRNFNSGRTRVLPELKCWHQTASTSKMFLILTRLFLPKMRPHLILSARAPDPRSRERVRIRGRPLCCSHPRRSHQENGGASCKSLPGRVTVSIFRRIQGVL